MRVRAAADGTESLSQQTTKRPSHSLDTSDEVYGSHCGNGWESPVRPKVCAEKWEEHMVCLARRMGELSRGLRESADGYDRARRSPTNGTPSPSTPWTPDWY